MTKDYTTKSKVIFKIADYIKIVEKHGWVENGAGDDFTSYNGNFADTGKPDLSRFVYLYEDGRWEFHDLVNQHGDEPENATARGKSVRSLDRYLAAFARSGR